MKRIYTILFLVAVTMTVMQLSAQDIDRSFVFVDENGTELENGATVIRSLVEEYDEDVEVIYSGLMVKKSASPTSNFLRLHYKITSFDNGVFQLCFPMNCEKQTEVGEYVTNSGSLMMSPQPLQSEWFPTDYGSCVVNLTIEVMKQGNSFPPQYEHLADGPSLTLRFVKKAEGSDINGDVNGDGAVNIGDVNYIIGHILSPKAGDLSADVNGDGNVNISDINAVIGIILK